MFNPAFTSSLRDFGPTVLRFHDCDNNPARIMWRNAKFALVEAFVVLSPDVALSQAVEDGAAMLIRLLWH
jgi:hypothetical protein